MVEREHLKTSWHKMLKNRVELCANLRDDSERALLGYSPSLIPEETQETCIPVVFQLFLNTWLKSDKNIN